MSPRPTSTRFLCCHFATSGALKPSHQRINVAISAIGLSLVTFFGIKKNIVVQACCGHFPLCSTFSKKNPRFLLSFPLSHPEGPWGGSHHTLLLSSPCTISIPFPIHTPLALAVLPKISSILRFSAAYPPNFVRPHHTVNALPILSLCFTTV